MAEIHTATERGRTARVTEILQADPNAVHLRSDLGDQPLHLAAHHGCTAIAKSLLAAGAQINAKTEMGKTPLHNAVWSQKPKMVELLLEQGADPTIEDDTGATPLYCAASTEDQPMCNVLQQKGVQVDPRSMIYLVSPEASIAAYNKSVGKLTKLTAQRLLWDAIRVNSIELLEFLFQHGADANAPMDNTHPLLVAVTHHRENLVRALLEHGASIDIKDDGGGSILEFSATYGAPKVIVDLLREYGATD